MAATVLATVLQHAGVVVERLQVTHALAEIDALLARATALSS